MQKQPRHFWGLLFALGLPAHPAVSQDFDLIFPGRAEVTAQITQTTASRAMPKGAFQNGAMATQTVEGPLAQTAFRIASDATLTTLELMTPLRDQIAAAGFTTVYQCETRLCGGFDFRYGMDLLPEPEMHVDLGDFRYILAQRETGVKPEYISLMVSRSPSYGFVHLTRMGDFAAQPPKVVAATKSPVLMTAGAPAPPAPDPAPDMTAALASGMAVVMEDLVFQPSKSSLATGEYPSLKSISDWLIANPAQRMKIIGHTDSSGRAEANMALSLARAESIRDWLIAQYGLAPDRITAVGMGDTAPRAANDTAPGRAKNRRVEAISTPTP